MPSLITRDEVERIARLARLELTEDEVALFTTQLGDILAYAQQLRDVDTTGVSPTSHVVTRQSALRADVPRASLDRPAALANAPDAAADEGLFKVPRVIG